MSKMLKFFLITALISVLSVSLAFTITPEKKPKTRNISEDFPADAPGSEFYIAPVKSDTLHTVVGIKYQTTCTDIDPHAGTIIEHTQVGDTWYDSQKNGSMGRMISVTNTGYRHISWMYCNGIYNEGANGNWRYVKANCETPAGEWIGISSVDGGPSENAGYSNQTHLSDGTSIVVYHRISGNPVWYASITAANGVGSSLFDRHWDIPDYIANAHSGFQGLWPKGEVQHDPITGRDYIHMVMTEGNTASFAPLMVAYTRCYIKDGPDLLDTMICQSYQGDSTKTYKIVAGANGGGSSSLISHFDSSCTITPIVAISPVSQRVAIAYMKPVDPAGRCYYLDDVCYIESMNSGDDWIIGAPWPPPHYNITNFGLTGSERSWNDLNACYDYQDSLHIVYITCGFDPASPGTYQPGVARLYHWSKKTGIRMISSAIWEGTKPGNINCNIAKMSISAMNPIYHPDSVYLYCIWTQFDTADNAANGYTNGDIYGAGSPDGGATWGLAFNLTNTKTPGCLPGECLSEHWSSMAQNLYNGNLHIQYVCDRDAGAAISAESQWLDNPIMYLELQPWNPLDTPLIAMFNATPRSGVAPLNVNFTDLSLSQPTSWFWHFGDDLTSTENNPSHIYSKAGSYDVKLVVSNGTETDSLLRYNYIMIFSQVIAKFSAQPKSGLVPLQVQFADSSQGNPTSWLWDFGDNSTSTSQNPNHTYSDTGFYNVRLIASNQVDTDTTVKLSYIHAFTHPAANFTAQPKYGFVPLTVQFYDSSDGYPTSWLWDFGDGNTDTAQNPIHTYSDTGYYDVKLIDSNTAGPDTLIKPDYIAVFETLTVDFTAQPIRGRKPLTVSFKALYNNIAPEYVTWYFGDGQLSDSLNPVHTYVDSGSYDVMLRAQLFNYRDSLAKEDFILVSDIKAEFSSNKRCGSIPLTVSFTDSSTSACPINNWYWDFGDGETSNQQNPTHQFHNKDVFDITLIVTDSIGSDTLKREDYITTQDGVSADLVGFPTSGRSPLTVMFEPILDGIANQYFWDFGDGDTSSLSNPIHAYTSQGKYDVKFKVKLELDECSQVDSSIKEDYVVVNDLEPRFGANPTAGVSPLLVQFADQSYGNPNSWFWDFGDNNTSFQQNPQHQYDTAGTYDVFLRVTNIVGTDSLLKLEYIHIDTPYVDLFAEISSSIARPGFDLYYYFVWTNIGTIPAENCTLKMLLPSEMTFYGLWDSSGTPFSQYSYLVDTIVVALQTIIPSGWYGGYLIAYGNLPSSVPISDTVVCKMWLSSATPDRNDSNNFVFYQRIVVGSRDPNDKLASPDGAGFSHAIKPDQRLAYTIQFENKKEATAEAIYIRVVDTLDQDLDWGTLAIGAMSHPDKCKYQFNPYTGEIMWFCDSIMLPPNVNPPEGEGFFTYSISPKSGLPNATELANTAWIRFDYNPWLQAPEAGPVIRTIQYPFIVGDANGDRIIDVGDVVYLINYLYKNGSAPNPLLAGDATCNGIVDVGDVVYLINYLFKSGLAPAC